MELATVILSATASINPLKTAGGVYLDCLGPQFSHANDPARDGMAPRLGHDAHTSFRHRRHMVRGLYPYAASFTHMAVAVAIYWANCMRCSAAHSRASPSKLSH